MPDAKFGDHLRLEQLVGLREELQNLRDHPPLIKRPNGKYEGDILGFIKGLRLSARVIYWFREQLSSTGLEVSWGHILSKDAQSCSPECDVVIHRQGCVREWNGSQKPIMEFKFVKADAVRAVISCKSQLRTIDKDYPASLKKHGIKAVFLFVECCDESHMGSLKQKARKAGYKGLCFLYSVTKPTGFYKTNDADLLKFYDNVLKCVAGAAS